MRTVPGGGGTSNIIDDVLLFSATNAQYRVGNTPSSLNVLLRRQACDGLFIFCLFLEDLAQLFRSLLLEGALSLSLDFFGSLGGKKKTEVGVVCIRGV